MAEITKKDMFDTLNEFYGKVLEPRFDRIEKRLDGHDQKFQDILNHFDQIYHRLKDLKLNTTRSVLPCRESRID
jgi:hypothetical protein